MKITTIKRPVSASQLKKFLDDKLNGLFEKKRQIALTFDIVEHDNAIDILNTANYDDFLFRIEVDGTQLRVIKSEHYTDDVNVLTLEDILNDLFLEFPGRDDIAFIEERS